MALEEGPWHFFQNLMILKQTEAMQSPTDVKFDEVSMWVQVHNVPLACMETSIIQRLGERVGRVEEVEVGEGGLSIGKVARARISRGIDVPLVRCVPLADEEVNKEILVILQYEKLPEFCFACGRIGHISKDCWDESVDKKEFKFEGWLRAGSQNGSRKIWREGMGSPTNLALKVSAQVDQNQMSVGERTDVVVETDKEDERSKHEEDYMDTMITPRNEEALEVEQTHSGILVDKEGGVLVEQADEVIFEGRAEVVKGADDNILADTNTLFPGKVKRGRDGKGWKRKARESKKQRGRVAESMRAIKRGIV